MGHSLCTETKGRREERAGPQGERGERGGWKRGEGPLRVSFQDGFYGVTSNADLPHPRPLHPPPPPPPLPRSIRPSVRPLVPPSSFSLLCMAKWTVIGYSFMRLISAPSAAPHPTPQEEALFAAPLEVSTFSVYVCVRCKYARR